MTIKKYQEEVDQWIGQHKIGYFPPLELLARMTEELGELSRELSHLHGSKVRKSVEDTADIKSEMGDLLFSICCMANYHKINLDEALTGVLEKIKTRDKDRWEKK